MVMGVGVDLCAKRDILSGCVTQPFSDDRANAWVCPGEATPLLLLSDMEWMQPGSLNIVPVELSSLFNILLHVPRVAFHQFITMRFVI